MHVSLIAGKYDGECEGQSYDDVLDTVFGFLQAHRSETVFIRVDDGTSANVSDTSSQPDFGGLVAEALMRVQASAKANAANNVPNSLKYFNLFDGRRSRAPTNSTQPSERCGAS